MNPLILIFLVFFAMCFDMAVGYINARKKHICFTIYYCSMGICIMVWLAMLLMRYYVFGV